MTNLVWFRSDLRTSDHRALHAACAGKPRAGVVGVYILSPGDFARHNVAAARVQFTLECLRSLSADLAKKNIPLLIRTAPKPDDVPTVLLETVKQIKATSVFATAEYEVNEAKRDARAATLLIAAGAKWNLFHDAVILEPGSVLTGDNRPYTVFTPFKRRWFATLAERPDRSVPIPDVAKQSPTGLDSNAIPERLDGFVPHCNLEMFPPGQRAAERRLSQFVESSLRNYKDRRDTPSVDGTSRLSAYLALGVLGPRQALASAAEANGGKLDAGDLGAQTWISELVWREFYKHVLHAFPRVCRDQPFKPGAKRIKWNDSPALLAAWQEGKTGYPIVDAAQRQLLATGWMHNRLRMITAMFFTKDLLLDWRLGELHFMRHLIDGDLAANNGGWQWSAGTGTDAAPYFRIFNPTTQGEKFDPTGAFVRSYVPELASVSGDAIHDPPPLLRAKLGYPAPTVDHAKARETTLRAYKAAAM